jgi:hypothetical protein
MLHRSLLPGHERWTGFWRSLSLVVALVVTTNTLDKLKHQVVLVVVETEVET